MSANENQTQTSAPSQATERDREDSESDGQTTQEPNRDKVFVITVGTGGLRTGQRLHAMEQELEPDLDMEYIPIESATIDNESTPNEFYGIPLSTNDRIKKEFAQAQEDPTIPYVTPFHSLNIQGATRNPAVGRFLLERHDERVKRSIGNEMRSTLDMQDNSVSIWLIGTASGGTGAGMLPLLAPLVRSAADGIESKFDLDVRVNAMVTVSELRTDGQRLDPEGRAEYYVNSSNTLQALATLQNIDTGGDTETRSVDRIRTPIARTMDQIDIETPPLDKLFIAPIEEAKVDTSRYDSDRRSSYLSRVNFKLAATVMALSVVSAGDIGNTYNQLNSDHYTVDGANIEATVQPALDLLDAQEVIRSERDEKERLESCKEALEQLQADIDTLCSTEFEAGSIPDVAEDISSEIAGRLSRFTDAASVLDVTQADFDEIESSMDRVVSDMPQRTADEDDFSNSLDDNEPEDFDQGQFVPHQVVAQHVFLNLILTRIEAKLEDHAFEQRVEDLWTKNEEELDAEVQGLADSDYVGRYEQGLEPYLDASETEVENELAETPWYKRGKRKRLQNKLDEIQATREQLRKLFDEYEHLESLQERLANTEIPMRETQLESVKELLQARQSVAQRLIGQKTNNISTAENRRETCQQRVSPIENFSGSIGDIPLGIGSIDELSRKSLTDATSLFDLIDDGLLDKDTILRQISSALDIVSEPLEDNFANSGAYESNRTLEKVHIPMTSRKNSDVLSMSGEVESNLQSINSRHDIGTVLSNCWVDDPFGLTMIILHGNVDLQNASEFRVVQERYRQGTLDQLLGSDIDLAHHAAFPELIPGVQPPAASDGGASGSRPINEVTDE